MRDKNGTYIPDIKESTVDGELKAFETIVNKFNPYNGDNLGWNEYFIKMAYLVASKSKDWSTKIGSVLVRDNTVLSCGFNGICIGCKDNIKERNERPEKYFYYEHSERNCFYFAARNGINTNNSKLITLSIPCADCARACIQSGTTSILYHTIHNSHLTSQNPKWAESTERSLKMFDEAKVKVLEFRNWLNIKCLINGKEFDV